MDYKEVYQEWLENPYFDENTKAELKSIAGDENEIKERFYMDLEFGTAGLRGVIGAGTNRMNIYVVRKTTQGLANYILSVGKGAQGVAIAYDSTCRRSSLRRLLFVWRLMESRRIFSNLSDQHQNFPSR